MFSRMVIVVLGLNVSCALFAGSAHADDAKDARVRKAKAALALAGTLETAPLPKLALLDYAAGSKLAIEKSEPLIVFCAAPRKECPKGAVCATAANLPGYPARCVVVSYPANGKLIESKTLPADPKLSEIIAAFEEAQKKSQAANPKGSEAPVDEWFISTDAPSRELKTAGEVDRALRQGYAVAMPSNLSLFRGMTVIADEAEEIAESPKEVLPPKLPVCTGPNCPECGQGGRPVDCKCGATCPCVGVVNARASAAITGFGRPHVFHGGHVRGFVHRVLGRFRR